MNHTLAHTQIVKKMSAQQSRTTNSFSPFGGKPVSQIVAHKSIPKTVTEKKIYRSANDDGERIDISKNPLINTLTMEQLCAILIHQHSKFSSSIVPGKQRKTWFSQLFEQLTAKIGLTTLLGKLSKLYSTEDTLAMWKETCLADENLRLMHNDKYHNTVTTEAFLEALYYTLSMLEEHKILDEFTVREDEDPHGFILVNKMQEVRDLTVECDKKIKQMITDKMLTFYDSSAYIVDFVANCDLSSVVISSRDSIEESQSDSQDVQEVPREKISMECNPRKSFRDLFVVDSQESQTSEEQVVISSQEHSMGPTYGILDGEIKKLYAINDANGEFTAQFGPCMCSAGSVLNGDVKVAKSVFDPVWNCQVDLVEVDQFPYNGNRTIVMSDKVYIVFPRLRKIPDVI